MPYPAESLTEKSNIKQIQDAIWKSTDQMVGEYQLDGKIGGEAVLSNWQQAWDYAREQSYKLARKATGRLLPEN